MVSTRSRMVGAKEGGPSQVNLVAILEGQAKMHLEFMEFKNRSVIEMEALKQQNSQLKRKIDVEAAHNQMKEKEILVDSKNPLYANSTLFAEEESEYNPIPHTAATTLTIAANKVKRWHPFVNGITETPLPMQ